MRQKRDSRILRKNFLNKKIFLKPKHKIDDEFLEYQKKDTTMHMVKNVTLDKFVLINSK